MGRADELLKERQKIPLAGTYIAPDQITGTELGALGMGTADIENSSIDENKIKATALDTTKALAGGGGVALSVVPDTTTVEMDGGAAGAKKIRLVDGGIGVDKLAALSSGGLTGGAGAAWAVDPDGVGLEINATQLALKDGGVTRAKVAVEGKLHRISTPLSQLAAGVLVQDAILAVPAGKTYRVTAMSLGAYTPPADANGTITADIVHFDVGVGDVVEVTGVDLEALVAFTGADLTIPGLGYFDMEAGDTLRIECTANDEGVDGIDANWVAPVLTVEFYEIV